MQPGDRVYIVDNPSRIGVLTNDEPVGEGKRRKRIVSFPDGVTKIFESSLCLYESESKDAYVLMKQGKYSGVRDLRGAITFYRLSGKLANLIYSLNTTNTEFLAYQFKPVLQFLDSPSNGIVIADEVGLGKTIEAGLIWTELRARQDAKRLLVVCPAMLREKWQMELENRFGVNAKIVDSEELSTEIKKVSANRSAEFALIVSMQGTRPPKSWDDDKEPSQSKSAKLAQLLDELSEEEPLIDLVIVDEAHYLRNAETQTHRFAKLLRPITDGLVLLSATPIQNKNSDLFNLLRLLDEDSFPNQLAYDRSLQANAPIVRLRDLLLRGAVTTEEFEEGIRQSLALRYTDKNEQLKYMLANLPNDEILKSPSGRADYADRLDRVNPRAKVISRTLKRDVQEHRVKREPVCLRVKMSDSEREFYDAVTNAVREYCDRQDLLDGFILTIPQRQMSSCMAAACQGWDEKLKASDYSESEENLVELVNIDPNLDSKPKADSRSGKLLQTLSSISRRVGHFPTLSSEDSKFQTLLSNLQGYWAGHPDKKVVLFAFYKKTLHYLRDRLEREGISAGVLHGGMDKQEILKNFASDANTQILLSSEVAAEGVDLQFSSLLINYDMPWNPAKVEQRIGRIDRIGQTAPKILIWNIIYSDTLDERIYERLLEKLNIFRTALGSMEEILGTEVQKLTSDLLSHNLTVEQETARIDQSLVAIEQLRKLQDELDERATELMGHGDFIQNKAKAAKELGRYITGEDLFFYVKDYLDREFPGSRIIVSQDKPRKGTIELSVDAAAHFANYLSDNRLQGRTSILSSKPKIFAFDNQAGATQYGIEKITQDHPLVRFISDRQAESETGVRYYSSSAVSVKATDLPVSIAKGTYVYSIVRWSFSGPRDKESLVYEVVNTADTESLNESDAESFVNAAANSGRDWQAEAANLLTHEEIAKLQDTCINNIQDRFESTKESQKRENKDRIREMIEALEQDLRRRSETVEDKIRKYEESREKNKLGMIPAERGKLKLWTQRYEEKKARLLSTESIDPRYKEVSSGVIHVE